MKITFPILMAFKSIFNRNEKGGFAAQHRGSILGIGLSIIPLIVVIVATNGMIEGITSRFIEISTYHIQISFFNKISLSEANSLSESLEKEPDIKHAFLEKDGFALIRLKDRVSGVSVKSVPENVYAEDEGFRKYFRIHTGEFNLSNVPSVIKKDVLENRILPRFDEGGEKWRKVRAAYKLDETTGHYVIKDDLTGEEKKILKGVFNTAGYGTLLLGKALSEKLDAEIGNEVFFLSLTQFHSQSIPKSARFIVSGVFSSGYQDIDKVLVYIPIEKGSQLLPYKATKQFIGVKVKNPFGNLTPIIERINDILLEKNYQFSNVESWYEIQLNQYKSYQMTKTILIFIMVLIIIVACVNVSSSMMMLTMEKTQEIAILKSMGANPGTISLSFVIIGLFIGVLGTFLGISSGLLVAVNINEVISGIEVLINGILGIFHTLAEPFVHQEALKPVKILNPEYYLERIPVIISFGEIFFIGFLTTLLSAFFSYFPARLASRIKPLQIIRKY
ncbi:MAG: ABC transporter permease [Spirochaetales bacterium]|nr:ABC transporter permease [Spirochaetales bacterium]